VMRKKNIKITEKTTCYAEQLPLPVSYFVKWKKLNLQNLCTKEKTKMKLS
jgi:hypothetical protein